VIGVFDSGIGGLTVYQALRRALPETTRLVYIGDTARVPYGTKGDETVVRYAVEGARFLMRRGVKALVVACNTMSAVALPALAQVMPGPVLGVPRHAPRRHRRHRHRRDDQERCLSPRHRAAASGCAGRRSRLSAIRASGRRGLDRQRRGPRDREGVSF
jgi:hypothetical protein